MQALQGNLNDKLTAHLESTSDEPTNSFPDRRFEDSKFTDELQILQQQLNYPSHSNCCNL